MEMIDDFLQNATETFENYGEGVAEKVDFDGVFGYILDLLSTQFKNCTYLFVSLSVVILLFSFADNFDFSGRKVLKSITGSVITLSILAICSTTLQSSLETLYKNVDTMKIFSTAAVPVIVTACISSGETFSAAVFSSAVSFSSTTFEYITDEILLPLIIIFIAIGVVGNLSDRFNITSLGTQIKKFIKWVIGIFVSIFSISLSLQNFLSKSSDTLTRRSIKMAVGSFIPMIGNTLSGSVDSLFSLAANSKTSFAIVGVIIISVIFLPSIIGNLCYGGVMSLVKSISVFLGCDKAVKAVAVVADVFYIITAITSVCVYMLIISFLLICINIG